MNKSNRSVAAVASAVAATFSQVVRRPVRVRAYLPTHMVHLFSTHCRAFARVAIGLPVYEHDRACARLLLRPAVLVRAMKFTRTPSHRRTTGCVTL